MHLLVDTHACRLAGAILLLNGLAAPVRAAEPADWPGWGGPSIGNQRFAKGETIISPATVAGLQLKWSFAARGNITSTPTLKDGLLYVTDDGGGLQAGQAATGKPLWTHAISDYTGQSNSASRSSPAIAGNLIIVADRHSGAVLGINRMNGQLVWRASIETNPYVTLTASPVVYGGAVFLGTASNEEYIVSVNATYVPSFRGSVVSLDAATGHLNWQRYMVPQGYTGGAVWGSGSAISASRGLIYVATGNNYTLPQSVNACIAAAGSAAAQRACLDPLDYVDSVVALNLATGTPKWDRRLQGLDTFNLNCRSNTPAQPCPVPTGKDYDFGSAPNLLGTSDLVGAGQKSGIYWALQAGTGEIAWHSRPAPGGVRGGILWGSAVDSTQVYVAENDSDRLAYRLANRGPRISGGSWAALDIATGAVDWQTAASGTGAEQAASPVGAEGTMSVANGVVFGGATSGVMTALSAADGHVLWSFQASGGITCGPAIVDGMVYWGSGDPYGTRGNTLYAFSLATR